MTASKGIRRPRRAKDIILAAIEDRGQISAMDAGLLLSIDHRNARSHLDQMVRSGEVQIIPKTFRPILYRLPIPVDTLVMADDGKPVQVLRPIGHWRVDHAVAPRSVFELGVA